MKNHREVSVVLTATLLLLCLFSTSTLAQTTSAQVSGQVTDPSGAVLSGATITPTNLNTGAVRSAASNETGHYSVPLLKPGNYEIKAEADGFVPAVVPEVTLEVNQAIQQNFSLRLGEAPLSEPTGRERSRMRLSALFWFSSSKVNLL